jgi:hypothetical protein
MSAGVNAELWDRWIELWNGDLDLAEQIIHPDFEVHRIPMPHVPEGLGGRAQWPASGPTPGTQCTVRW